MSTHIEIGLKTAYFQRGNPYLGVTIVVLDSRNAQKAFVRILRYLVRSFVTFKGH